jgi:hypothetical protein
MSTDPATERRLASLAAALLLVPPAVGVTTPIVQLANELFSDEQVRGYREAHPDGTALPQGFLIDRRGDLIV